MLQATETFDQTTRMAALIRNWCAICPETGAYLIRSRGQSRAGNPCRYTLIVPRESLDERDGFFSPRTWGDNDRKLIRAHTDAEAIELANAKLQKVLDGRTEKWR